MAGLAACAGGPPPPAAIDAAGGEPGAIADLEAYRLRPGDVVAISVWNNPELSRSVPIAPDGQLQFPFVGEVDAAGRTLTDIERAVTAGLAEQLVSPQVSVALEQLRSYRIYVTGQVTRPGAFDLDGPVSAVQAIAMAGGLTPFASRTDILLYNPGRDGERRRVFDYDRFLADPAAADVVMSPGDTLIVR